MNRQAQSAVLFLLGAALWHAGTTDLYLRYVKAGLRPLLLAAAVVLVAAAVASVGYGWRAARRGAATGPGSGSESEYESEYEYEYESGPECGPQSGSESGSGRPAGSAGHGHHAPHVSWLLLLPLLALILVAPPALGSYSATRTGTALQQPLAYPALPATDPLRLSVVDYAGRAVYGRGRTLEGRRVQVTGFVAVDRAGTPYLVRMALNCCAADAQPVKIGLIGAIPPVLQPDTWLTVTGTYTPRTAKDPVNGGPIPFLRVTAATPVPVPHDPYDESWNT
ncbi:TIGR03943 family putative permease subunit [Streptomyces galbus]|uniref:TIGR03943 family protein n=1 Tax=Streptomyces galbus TaxID=33898 RepID=A0A4U5WV23_STRGB|nr:TIGR03943 family protein [Streptomyces galbus]TKT06294.1 TIGR03943 family protein [Streptomyces galbus]GHD47476.1 membrane protein [Streptomyces galbus]